MIRVLFKLTSALSLLLCVGTVVLRVRARSVSDRLDLVPNAYDSYGLKSLPEGICAFHENEGIPLGHFGGWAFHSNPLPLPHHSPSDDNVAQYHSTSFMGFKSVGYDLWVSYFKGSVFYSQAWRRNRQIITPYWALVLLTSLLPTLSTVRRLRRGRRFPNGFCAACGYDLRATPRQCPECGAVPKSARMKA